MTTIYGRIKVYTLPFMETSSNYLDIGVRYSIQVLSSSLTHLCCVRLLSTLYFYMYLFAIAFAIFFLFKSKLILQYQNSVFNKKVFKTYKRF